MARGAKPKQTQDCPTHLMVLSLTSAIVGNLGGSVCLERKPEGSGSWKFVGVVISVGKICAKIVVPISADARSRSRAIQSSPTILWSVHPRDSPFSTSPEAPPTALTTEKAAGF